MATARTALGLAQLLSLSRLHRMALRLVELRPGHKRLSAVEIVATLRDDLLPPAQETACGNKAGPPSIRKSPLWCSARPSRSADTGRTSPAACGQCTWQTRGCSSIRLHRADTEDPERPKRRPRYVCGAARF